MNHVNLLLCQAGPGLATKESLRFFALWCEKCCEKLTKLNFFDSHLEKLCCCFQNYFFVYVWPKKWHHNNKSSNVFGCMKKPCRGPEYRWCTKTEWIYNWQASPDKLQRQNKKGWDFPKQAQGPSVAVYCTVYQNSFSGALSSLRWGKGLWDEIYTVPK